MKRYPIVMAVLCSLAVVLSACQAPSKATGFPKDIAEPTTIEEPGVIEVVDSAFEPAETTVEAGTEVLWEQTGSAPHNVVSDDGLFDSHPDCGKDQSKCMSQGNEFKFMFDEAGIYPYYCVIHGSKGGIGMAGTVTVE